MPYQTMSTADVFEFLSTQPARPGALASTRKDGRPHVAPIWYLVDGEPDNFTIVFNTGAQTVKGRSLRRTGLASLMVQDDRAPFTFVTVQGTVTISEDHAEVREWAGRLGARYMGADREEEFAARNGVPGELLVRLTPVHLTGARDVAD
ncbi:PPOX class F420-dependent oxidoreductase [Demetria terragena]|uniref:PPOX class F420-dependent oxidoreductase n=1 Tax=Demetria terragena TaxID=63959 RepID=UPI00036382BC|nr:PPOX class F420-dependent oxidoreductase [Demetria terragena]